MIIIERLYDFDLIKFNMNLSFQKDNNIFKIDFLKFSKNNQLKNVFIVGHIMEIFMNCIYPILLIQM